MGRCIAIFHADERLVDPQGSGFPNENHFWTGEILVDMAFVKTVWVSPESGFPLYLILFYSYA